jgi:hypothetical protein
MLPFTVTRFTRQSILSKHIWMPLLTFIPLLTAFLFFPVKVRAQRVAGDVAQQVAADAAQQAGDDKILNIRTVFNRINADSSLRKIVLDEEEWADGETTDGRGNLTGYFSGDTLCKMSLWAGISYAVVKESYYFNKGVLVFVYESEDDYSTKASGMMNYSRLVHVFDGRYYFDGDKVFKTIVKGKKKEGPDDPHHPLELYHNAHYYYGLLMKKKGGAKLTASH